MRANCDFLVGRSGWLKSIGGAAIGSAANGSAAREAFAWDEEVKGRVEARKRHCGHRDAILKDLVEGFIWILAAMFEAGKSPKCW